MPVAKVVQAQRDFSGGEADIWLKRADDHPLLKTSARQMSNWRPLSSRSIANRPGRRLMALDGPRVDEVIMATNQNFFLVFGNTYLRIYNQAGTIVFATAGMQWTTTTAKSIVWDVYRFSIYICFNGVIPLVLTWDGVSQTSTWTITNYNETITSSGQKRTVFYRLSPLGITLQPSALTGSVTLQFSAGMTLSNFYVGTRIRYCNRQILITNVTNATTAIGTVQENLPWSTTVSTPGPNTYLQTFAIGDEIIGSVTGAKAVVTNISGDGLNLQLQHLSFVSFQGGETLVGPNGTNTFGSSTGQQPPAATTIWDDEAMNGFRGWPRSVCVDQSRLVFSDFPALSQLVTWSAVGDFFDLYTDANNANATNAIQELVPGKSRVLFVVPGAEGSEFVFCDNAIYYVPINQTTPLKPGSVAFNTLMSEGAAQVQPRPVQQSIVYISAGFTQLKAVQAIGAYNRPYIVDDISELHSHLLVAPFAIAAPGGSDQFEESYFYIANGDGTLVLCSYNLVNGLIDTKTIGWLPWSGAGTATWISALKGHSDVIVSSTYAPGGAAAVNLFEQVDTTKYLDASMLYNGPYGPSYTPGPGQGPLWWIAGGTVDLMDGLRMMGTYQVDANGFLVAQNNAGEDFTSATLACGQAWTATFEPYVPPVQPGQDVNQRLRKRRIQRFEVYVQNSTGFTMCRLFGGPVTRTSPALGTIMQRRRIATWNQDDDPTTAPPLREQSYSERPLGRLHDPRVAIIKDTPGPLTILECDLEVSV